MWKVVYEAKCKKARNATVYVTQTPKGFVVAHHPCTSAGASDIVYKKIDNAVKSADRLASAG